MSDELVEKLRDRARQAYMRDKDTLGDMLKAKEEDYLCARAATEIASLREQLDNALEMQKRRLADLDNLRKIGGEIRRERDSLRERVRVLEEAGRAGVRCAKLALFVIRKQNVMPNSSWESGFNDDLATAEAALPANEQSAEQKQEA